MGSHGHAGQTESLSPNYSSTSTPTSGGEAPTGLGGSPGVFSLNDLRLLHHFTSETAQAIAYRQDLLEVFAREVPRLAYTQEYVMRAILAVSALHIASSSGPSLDEAMVATASYHINEGMVQSRYDLANLSERNCHTVFAFSVLLSLYYIALPLYQSRYGVPGEAIDRLVESMELIRGSATVAAGGREWVRHGPLRAVMEHADWLPPPPNLIPPQIDAHLRWLVSQMRGLDASLEEIAAYHEAIWSLERVFKQVCAIGVCNHTNYALAWAAFVPPMFLEGLKLRKPPALAILGYFCPLLQKHWGGWVVTGWQGWLLGDVEAGLQGTFWRDAVMLAAAQLDVLLARNM